MAEEFSRPTQIQSNRFKNSNGTHLLKPLFYELDEPGRPNAVYTLKDYDAEFEGKTYPSLRKLYVETEDPTEYNFATMYLDNWSHWKKLSSASFFSEYIQDWREELELRLRAKGLVGIRQIAQSTGKDNLTANRYLAQAGWKLQEDKEKVGRPTKQKIRAEAERLFNEQSVFDEDYDRIVRSSKEQSSDERITKGIN